MATCGVIDLELLSRVTDLSALADVTQARSISFRWLATTDADLRAAVGVHRDLLEAGAAPACWPDRMVAAVARQHDVAVLHHDPCFDLISKVTCQDMRWVIPEVGTDTVGGAVVRPHTCAQGATCP